VLDIPKCINTSKHVGLSKCLGEYNSNYLMMQICPTIYPSELEII